MDTIAQLAILALSNADFADFITQSHALPPQEIAAVLPRITPEQRQLLHNHEQLGVSLHTACHSSPQPPLRWKAPSGWWSCSELIDIEQQAAGWGADTLLTDYTAQQIEAITAALLDPDQQADTHTEPDYTRLIEALAADAPCIAP
jgi:hypothetical protein